MKKHNPPHEEKEIEIFDAIKKETQTVKTIIKSAEDWIMQLDEEQYRVARKKGTERAFTGKFWNSKDKGIYTCVCCETHLFHSDAKFDSGTGWPSYWQPVSDKNIEERSDVSYFVKRTEVVCPRCDAHLGHVFSDGPEPTGLRYCMNSAAMGFLATSD